MLFLLTKHAGTLCFLSFQPSTQRVGASRVVRIDQIVYTVYVLAVLGGDRDECNGSDSSRSRSRSRLRTVGQRETRPHRLVVDMRRTAGRRISKIRSGTRAKLITKCQSVYCVHPGTAPVPPQQLETRHADGGERRAQTQGS